METIKSFFELLITIGTLNLLLSCQSYHMNEPEASQTTLFETHTNDIFHLEKEFAIALSKALFDSKEIREIIKNEALKEIDYDNDVLYLLVKDRILSEGCTIRDVLLRYLGEDIISQIEKELPTLTILVPTLPEDIFSATLWDIDNDIPCVAVRTSVGESTPVYNHMGEELLFSDREIPAYPVVVVKINERIIVNKANTRKGVLGNASLQFCNEVFDNLSSANYLGTECTNNNTIASLTRQNMRQKPNDDLPTIPQKVVDAYNIYNSNDGWQRDYIYYGLTPANKVGPFDKNYEEYLVGFEMTGDASANLNKISDQPSDPKRTKDMSTNRSAKYWTDGEFEFKVKLYVGNKSGFGSEIVKYFRIKPEELFRVIIKSKPNRIQYVAGIDNRRVALSLPLFKWNLENFSTSVKIAIEEVDEAQTTKITNTTSTEFAGNFEFSITTGERVKTGLKFGASAKEVRTISYEVTTTNGNDELGEVVVNFYDDVIVPIEPQSEGMAPSGNNQRGGESSENKPATEYYNKEYSTGWCRLYITPRNINE
ncbi:MAG: hypothetical protein LBM62_02280 [Mediterranea sp.]|jgi:hypothetical protein|nr:hypothetical protein [Mediterranea sp.]